MVYLLKMVIFHGYVNLPEGTHKYNSVNMHLIFFCRLYINIIINLSDVLCLVLDVFVLAIHTVLSKVHAAVRLPTLLLEKEIEAGHVFWSCDWSTVWFVEQLPRLRSFVLTLWPTRSPICHGPFPRRFTGATVGRLWQSARNGWLHPVLSRCKHTSLFHGWGLSQLQMLSSVQKDHERSDTKSSRALAWFGLYIIWHVCRPTLIQDLRLAKQKLQSFQSVQVDTSTKCKRGWAPSFWMTLQCSFLLLKYSSSVVSCCENAVAVAQ